MRSMRESASNVIAGSVFDLLTIERGEWPSARADKILSALDAAGYAVVPTPKEPTEEMLRTENKRLKAAVTMALKFGYWLPTDTVRELRKALGDDAL